MRAKTAVAILAVLLFVSCVAEWELASRQPSGASPLNTGPEGTSNLVRTLVDGGLNVSIVRSWSGELKRLKPCLIVTISPELPYSEAELGAIRELVGSGANILVADEGTNSNEILRRLGIPAIVSGRILLARGERVFAAAARIDGVELNVTYALSSSLVLPEALGGGIEVISSIDGNVLAIAFSAGDYEAVVVSDGTVFTNALLNPRNALNHNYVFAYRVVRKLCSRGTVLIEGSKYELRPRQPADGGASPAAYLTSLSRAIGATLLVAVLTYAALPRLKTAAVVERARGGEVAGGYEVAKTICQSAELSNIFSNECATFARTRRARRLLEAVTSKMREDKEVSKMVLKAVTERGAPTERA